jgi:hypothetical protein
MRPVNRDLLAPTYLSREASPGLEPRSKSGPGEPGGVRGRTGSECSELVRAEGVTEHFAIFGLISWRGIAGIGSISDEDLQESTQY